MNPSLFEEYDDIYDAKPILRIGDFGLIKYKPKEEVIEGVEYLSNGVTRFENGEFGRKQAKIALECLDNGQAMEFIESKKKRGITNERQQILEDIRTIINQERKDSKEKKKYPPITGRALALKLSHIPTSDLHFMISEGKDYKARKKGDFSKYIFGSIRVKK